MASSNPTESLTLITCNDSNRSTTHQHRDRDHSRSLQPQPSTSLFLSLPTELLLMIISDLSVPNLYALILTHPFFASRLLSVLRKHYAKRHTYPTRGFRIRWSHGDHDYGVFFPKPNLPLAVLNFNSDSARLPRDPLVWSAIYARCYLLDLLMLQYSRRRLLELHPKYSYSFIEGLRYEIRTAALDLGPGGLQKQMRLAVRTLIAEPALTLAVLGKPNSWWLYKAEHEFRGWYKLVHSWIGTGRLSVANVRGGKRWRRDDNGLTPLILATIIGDIEIVNALLEAGADPAQRVQGLTATDWAAYMGHQDVKDGLRTYAERHGLQLRYKTWKSGIVCDLEFAMRTDYFSFRNRWRRWRKIP